MINGEKWRDTKIEDCELRIRTRRMCADAGLETLGDVDALDRLELKALGLGMVAIYDLRDILLGMPGSRWLKLWLAKTKREELESRIRRLEIELIAAKAELAT